MKKICTACKHDKELKEFPIHKAKRKDGIKPVISSQCKKCTNRKKYERTINNPISLEKYRERCRKRAKRQYQANPQISAERVRQFTERKIANGTFKDLWLKKKYGISLDEYNNMKADQEGCCKICKRHESEIGKGLVVDHCHKEGHVRGLLCGHCNRGLGDFKENINSLQLAIKYLENKFANVDKIS